jgi:hypothetical protein
VESLDLHLSAFAGDGRPIDAQVSMTMSAKKKAHTHHRSGHDTPRSFPAEETTTFDSPSMTKRTIRPPTVSTRGLGWSRGKLELDRCQQTGSSRDRGSTDVVEAYCSERRGCQGLDAKDLGVVP